MTSNVYMWEVRRPSSLKHLSYTLLAATAPSVDRARPHRGPAAQTSAPTPVGPMMWHTCASCNSSPSAPVPEVYFPARGWMCVDATDPTKGNWLRYVNWAHSSEEQNLFPLEINRAIYYKVLRVSRRFSGIVTGKCSISLLVSYAVH